MVELTRRKILQLFGLAGASLLPCNLARAQSTPPKRIIFFYTSHGTLRQRNPDGSFVQYWAPTAPAAPDAMTLTAPWSTNQHTLGDMHQPLVPYTNDLLFLDGIDMASLWVDPTTPDGAHAAGRNHSLIAVNRVNADVAGGISLDQYIANGLNTPSPVTRLPTLQMICQSFWNDLDQPEDTPLYAGRAEPITVPGSPVATYNMMFPNGPQNDTDAAAAAAVLAQRRSVLDHVLQDFNRLSAKAGTLDQQRLATHASAIRDLEQRLALPAVTCVEPDASITSSATADSTGASYNATADVMARLIQVSLACDLTRVVTFVLEEAPPDCFGFTPVSGAPTFHDLVHATNGVLDGSGGLMTDPSAIATVKAYHTFNARQFANLLSLLDSIRESDGSTLLDNTLIFWTGELAGGDHSVDHLPYILAGNVGGALSSGRYVRFPRKQKQIDPCTQSSICSDTLGPAHNDFLAALANLMGVSTTVFGSSAVSSGAPLGGWQT